ncbi:MAG: hypothetical protein COT92_03340 [Candidatus Doudnabacteria bacterium CG10_big_fil_rev_8_21_14_0_10_42_18]|uniref:EfeO-type cupredoxin-like domain-containing protein n=1 Tax=Candidatus Doudnabacteria bacterium CG10_big_fil_rev_8_21_14_0_10_42_18 TaxID=1974552 RepID=A0A2H0VA87_9BACT|nr:MAG: hypothetical protein COT92_03340 [Candidatus Doudnabacteria bacterium CG10_big_fil_rev_8_21_14_0_10_42_18]
MDEDNTQNASSGGSKSALWIVLIVIVIGLIAYFALAGNDNKQQAGENESQSQEMMDDGSMTEEEVMKEDGDTITDGDGAMMDEGDAMTPNESQDDSTGQVGEVKTFTLEAGMFYFSPKEIRVRKGDRVKIVLNNVEGFHDFVIDEFNASTPQIQAPNTAEVEFVADKAGTFEFYCSVGNHRAMGMVGTFIVEE